MTRQQIIGMKCDQAGCPDTVRTVHFQQFVKKGWDAHPSAAFLAWWHPYERQPDSGASIGGHPDAVRWHARKDPGGWTRLEFGTSAEVAWNTAYLREEFAAWQDAGSPEPDTPYVSLALPLREQKARWARLEAMVHLALPPPTNLKTRSLNRTNNTKDL